MIMKELRSKARSRSPLCVGLDLREDHIPQEIVAAYDTIEERLVAYAKEAVDCSREYAAGYKVQIACYEAEGLAGMRAYARILEYIRSKGETVIADIKRGDIDSTAKMYARGHFEGDFEADILTLNPYMGRDAIAPYFDYFKQGKGAFILGKTSNRSSADFQDLDLLENEGSKFSFLFRPEAASAFWDWKLYMKVLKTIIEWNQELTSEADDYPMGAVVGVNAAQNIQGMKQLTDELFLLVPGYGAQGAKIEDIKELIGKRKNGVVNVSRGYTANIEGDFRKELSMRAQRLAKELSECFE